MSSSESDSSNADNDHYDYGSRLCTCVLSDNESESSETTDFGDSVTEESSSEEELNQDLKKICYISVSNTKEQKDTFFICNYKEILEYRKKLKKYNQKNISDVHFLWGEVKARIPGHIYVPVPLKTYDKSLCDESKKESVSSNKSKNTVQDNKYNKANILSKSKKKVVKKPDENQIAKIINNLSNEKKTDDKKVINNKNIVSNTKNTVAAEISKEKKSLGTSTQDKSVQSDKSISNNNKPTIIIKEIIELEKPESLVKPVVKEETIKSNEKHLDKEKSSTLPQLSKTEKFDEKTKTSKSDENQVKAQVVQSAKKNKKNNLKQEIVKENSVKPNTGKLAIVDATNSDTTKKKLTATVSTNNKLTVAEPLKNKLTDLIENKSTATDSTKSKLSDSTKNKLATVTSGKNNSTIADSSKNKSTDSKGKSSATSTIADSSKNKPTDSKGKSSATETIKNKSIESTKNKSTVADLTQNNSTNSIKNKSSLDATKNNSSVIDLAKTKSINIKNKTTVADSSTNSSTVTDLTQSKSANSVQDKSAETDSKKNKNKSENKSTKNKSTNSVENTLNTASLTDSSQDKLILSGKTESSLTSEIAKDKTPIPGNTDKDKVEDTNSVEHLSKKQRKKLNKKKREASVEADPSNPPKVTVAITEVPETESNEIIDHQNSPNTIEKKMSDSWSNDDDIELEKMIADKDNIPAFYTKLFKKEKSHKVKSKKTSSLPRSAAYDTNGSSESDIDEFQIKKKRTKNTVIATVNAEESEKCGAQAIEMILNNNLTSAINCLTKAMSLNPSDYRHYLNRSYCYLRVEKPSYALSDAQTVIQSTKNLGFLFMANLRAGQSEHILKKYPQSETFLREALSIYPDSPHAQRELLRVQIARIMEHDHPEKHAIFALEKFNSTADAIKYLKDNYIPKGNDSEPETFLFDSEYDNQVIDESNMENSYAEALNRLMTVRPETKLRHVAQPFLSWLRPSSSGSDKSKTSSNTSLYGKNVQVTQNAVWVGNLTEQITEKMIKKAFRSYGPVLSVHRPEGKAFGFVNFEKTEDATKLLKNTGSVNINGIECLLRAAIRKD